MRTSERHKRIEEELRTLCARIKHETKPKAFVRALLKELRQDGHIALQNWEQNDHHIDILSWKYGIAIAINIRDENAYIEWLAEDLENIRHEHNPERQVLKFCIQPFAFSGEELRQLHDAGAIALEAGDLNLAPEPVAVTQELQDDEMPF